MPETACLLLVPAGPARRHQALFARGTHHSSLLLAFPPSLHFHSLPCAPPPLSAAPLLVPLIVVSHRLFPLALLPFASRSRPLGPALAPLCVIHLQFAHTLMTHTHTLQIRYRGGFRSKCKHLQACKQLICGGAMTDQTRDWIEQQLSDYEWHRSHRTNRLKPCDVVAALVQRGTGQEIVADHSTVLSHATSIEDTVRVAVFYALQCACVCLCVLRPHRRHTVHTKTCRPSPHAARLPCARLALSLSYAWQIDMSIKIHPPPEGTAALAAAAKRTVRRGTAKALDPKTRAGFRGRKSTLAAAATHSRIGGGSKQHRINASKSSRNSPLARAVLREKRPAKKRKKTPPDHLALSESQQQPPPPPQPPQPKRQASGSSSDPSDFDESRSLADLFM